MSGNHEIFYSASGKRAILIAEDRLYPQALPPARRDPGPGAAHHRMIREPAPNQQPLRICVPHARRSALICPVFSVFSNTFLIEMPR